MNRGTRNILAIIVGIIIGSAVNLGLVNIGSSVIPLPEGADISSTENLRESMRLFKPANFIFPFLAHALGTFAGAFTAAKLAASHHVKLALGVSLFFLLGGISMVVMAGGPVWFIVVDLFLAYIPMGFLGGVLGGGKMTEAA